VTISGGGFTGATAVLFGTNTAPSFTVVSDTEITVTTPARSAGTVDVTVRTPGEDIVSPRSFLFTGRNAAAIDWCSTQHPTSTTAAAGTTTEVIYGQVFVPGMTEPVGVCSGDIVSHLGYGPRGTNPSTTNGWTWTSTSCNRTCLSCGNNDEFMSTLTVATAGDYAYAFRFSTDGINYRYCDEDGGSMATDQYSTTDEAELTVTP
jgi:hypothetical protein